MAATKPDRPDSRAELLLQAAAAVVILIALAYNSMLFRTGVETMNGNDFGMFYYAAKEWMAGRSLYEPNPANNVLGLADIHDMLNMNPPHLHLLVLPLVRFSLATAAHAWQVVNLAAGLAAVFIVADTLDLRLRRRHLLPLVAVAMASAATEATIVTGQFTGLLLLLLVLAWRAMRQGAWMAAGIWLGVIVSVKPFLAFFMPALLVRRDVRTALCASAAAALAFAVGLAVFGVGAHVEWLRALAAVHWQWRAMNGSLQGFLVRLFGDATYYAPLTKAPLVVSVGWYAGVAVIGVTTLWTARRSVDHAFGSVVLGSLLISPLGWVYYQWLAAPACVALWQRRLPRAAIVGLLAGCVPLIAILAGQPHWWATATVGSAYFWSTLALWVAVSRTVEGGSPAPSPCSPAKP